MRVRRVDIARTTAFISGIRVLRHIFFPSGRRIVALTAPRIAPAYAPKALPGATQRAVYRYRIDEILRALRVVPAAAHWATEKMQRWRNDPLVDADEKYEDRFHLSAESISGFGSTAIQLPGIFLIAAPGNQAGAMQHPFPFFLQLFTGCICREVSGNHDQPVSRSDALAGAMKDSAHSASKSIPDDSSAHFPGGDEAQFEGLVQFRILQKSEHKKFPPNRLAFLSNSLEIRTARNSPAAG